MFESVVLPAPFSPSSACTSPTAASKSTWSFATTAGNRFVIPRSATAVAMVEEESGGEARASPPTESALGAADHAFDEPVHRVEVLDRQALPFRDTQLALLVVERTCELVERPLDQSRPLLRYRSLRLGSDLRSVRGQTDHAVLEAAVVEVRLPGPVDSGLGLAQVVRAPVVDRSGQPLLGSERVGVGIVTDPGHTLRLRVLAGRRTVDVLAKNVRACGDETLCRLFLLTQIKPVVGPDQPDLCAGMRCLRTERECVGMPDDLGNRKRDDVTDHTLLRAGTGCHPGQVDPILSCSEVLRHVLRLSGAGCHLELHVRILLRSSNNRRLEAEGRGEDDLVAVADEALDDLCRLRAFRHELFVCRLNFRAELALDIQAPLVVSLRPAVVVMRTDVHPGGLECRSLLLRPGRAVRNAERENQRGGEHKRQAEGEPACFHVLLSPVPKDRAWRL